MCSTVDHYVLDFHPTPVAIISAKLYESHGQISPHRKPERHTLHHISTTNSFSSAPVGRIQNGAGGLSTSLLAIKADCAGAPVMGQPKAILSHLPVFRLLLTSLRKTIPLLGGVL